MCLCVSSQPSIMAYHAGIPEDPSALVHNISSNIQKLTLLSNTHTIHIQGHDMDLFFQLITCFLWPILFR